MTKVKHLEKVAEIVKDVRTCMFSTMNNKGEMRARPMATAQYDDQGDIWFFTNNESAKLDDLENQQPILLTYADPSDNTYLSLTGKAYQIDDMSKKQELFNSFTKVWFPNGPESPDLTLIKFVTDVAEYWDSSDSNIVQLFRIGKAMLTNEAYETKDDEHGTVRINN